MGVKRSIAVIAVIVSVVSCLALAGCQGQQAGSGAAASGNLVGTWTVSMGSQPSSGGPTWQFTKDGKMIQGKGASVQNTTATYTLSGNTLTLITTDKGKSVPTTMTIQWVTPDQFKGVLSGMGTTPLVLTRQK